MNPERAQEVEHLIDQLVEEEHELAPLLRELLDAAIEHSAQEAVAWEAVRHAQAACEYIATKARKGNSGSADILRVAESGAQAWTHHAAVLGRVEGNQTAAE